MQNRNSILSSRIASIIFRLFQGETVYLAKLAEEYGVHQRTIRRDIEDRLSFLDIRRSSNTSGYYLQIPTNKKLDISSIEFFSKLAGVSGLFPKMNKTLVNTLLNNSEQHTFLVHGHKYISDDINSNYFQSLQQSISEHLKVSFLYINHKKEKNYLVEPYKLINYNGIWYLTAKHENKIKNFSLIKMKHLSCTFNKFTLDEGILTNIIQEESVWACTQKIEVTLKISPVVAEYFLRRQLLNEQQIKSQNIKGELIVSTRVSHKKEILPIVQYWIPYIKIIEPDYFQKELENTIKIWLNE